MEMEHICSFCLKCFTTKVNLLQHQRTVKSCLLLQGKQTDQTSTECVNCKKILSLKYYKQHKLKCDIITEEKRKHENEAEKTKLYFNLQDKYKVLERENKNLKYLADKYELELKENKNNINSLEKENEKLKYANELLEKQNEKLQSISTSVTMKLAEKVNTVNNNNTVVINTNQLTNDVLRQCATTFSLDNAYNINGITKHLTNSLEDHIVCTDPSRNIFKYTNEKDEEIVDHNLEILLPQYLTAVKDRNNFLYKEVFEYFEKNNVSLDVKTDYQVFYNALNNIISKNGQQSKYTEKCKREMVKECKRRFLEKNKNKEKALKKELTIEEIMMNIIETGGSVHDFVDRCFRYFDDEESDEQFFYRREMEDLFREKKREWKKTQTQNDI
jgi:hypothetical protein